jgi:hypothetical protein
LSNRLNDHKKLVVLHVRLVKGQRPWRGFDFPCVSAIIVMA